jgi:thiol peroxidase
MAKKITIKGNTFNLVGRAIKIGDPAPFFRVTSQDLNEVNLSGFNDKIKVVTFFPSLDTPVCDLQVKEFNKQALNLSGDIIILAISKDLPFAQKRFCSSNDINNIQVLSDYRFSSFGINYGVLIKELNLLARGVAIIDKTDILRYFQLTEELTSAVNFNDALGSLKEVLASPQSPAKGNVLKNKCVPCEVGGQSLPLAKVNELLSQIKGWQLLEDKKIVKEFKFNDFIESKYFLDLVAVLAEDQGHHPNMSLNYNRLKISLTTHAAGGLTDNDFIMANLIDGLNA